MLAADSSSAGRGGTRGPIPGNVVMNQRSGVRVGMFPIPTFTPKR